MNAPPAATAALLGLLFANAAAAADLKVCADPNNLPFSNRQEQGFENKIATLIARELGMTVRYTWWAQRRGYVRNTLKSEDCDLWGGVATDVDMVLPTMPYYRSSYVFVTRADRNLHVASFDDPALRKLKIGVQMIGDDADNTPPAHVLAARGIIQNVRGYMIYGDYATPNPPARIIEAVDNGEVDVAAVWGPLAGYFAAKAKHPLSLTPVTDTTDDNAPMQFDISIGVRKNDLALKHTIDRILIRRRAEIGAILASYRIPTVDPVRSRKPATGAKAFVSTEKGDVVEIDLDTFTPRAVVEVGGRTPRGIGLSRDGRLLVTANKDTNDVSVIDLRKGRLARRIPLGPSPEFVRMRGDMAYVTYEPSAVDASEVARPAEVAIINPRNGVIAHRMPSGVETEGLAFSADGARVIATNEGDETLTIADANTGAPIRKVDTRAFGARPRGIASLPNGAGYAVTFESSSTLVLFDNDFNPVRKVPTKMGPYGVASDASGTRLIVAAARAGVLQVFDPASLALLAEVPVGHRCWHFTFTPDNRDILVACGRSNEVEVIDSATYRRVTAIRGLDMPWGVVTWPRSYGTLDRPEARR